MSTPTITCPPWCTEHDDETDLKGVRTLCHNTARRSIDTGVTLDEGPATLMVHMDQFLCYGHLDPDDDYHEQPKVNVVMDGCYTTFTPGAARQLAVALLELADLAEQADGEVR
jgi:hypothetical protein